MLELVLSGVMYVLQAGVLMLAAKKLLELLKAKVDDGDPNNETAAEMIVGQADAIATSVVAGLEEKLKELVQKKIDEEKSKDS